MTPSLTWAWLAFCPSSCARWLVFSRSFFQPVVLPSSWCISSVCSSPTARRACAWVKIKSSPMRTITSLGHGPGSHCCSAQSIDSASSVGDRCSHLRQEKTSLSSVNSLWLLSLTFVYPYLTPSIRHWSHLYRKCQKGYGFCLHFIITLLSTEPQF